ncbi:hypothetical protein ACFVVL_27715 [Kitasatospora sp. NPDC058115]|uniref:hypothetical protein n=1 Tax=Kitasatospora sp. NPDC058115 TaxID=3346347 RepID=UPI0036DEFA2A
MHDQAHGVLRLLDHHDAHHPTLPSPHRRLRTRRTAARTNPPAGEFSATLMGSAPGRPVSFAPPTSPAQVTAVHAALLLHRSMPAQQRDNR